MAIIEQWISLQTLIWLFPIAFILHDFEEIIAVEKWFTAKSVLLHDRLPERLVRMIMKRFSITTAQFAAAVVVIFLFVSSSAYMASQSLIGGPMGNIRIFIVLTLVFFLHLFTHVAQSVYFRTITPGAITSLVIVLPYSLVLYSSLFTNHIIKWSTVFTSLPFVLLIVPVVLFAHWVGKKAV